ncbi:glycoside hydrolase family 97 catalytic domain-containing protein [Alteribacillus bidgolensis]|uniref:Glycosyl-hydrolase 97 C-terminal, oligomerisation n=1 Tax=Alteribacillus bidgolensis TaxID=930129 RepID=A0A1G8GXU8_9BACI|nr:glycoside hydrolase family 97 catalytic domain-containing protein [Alteribacillus bidgolensis]SDH99101.1 Glycosyl-hydrolase 97 C-terminal, oligomerisation [Alteribacillus bidgolensis]
MEIKRRFISVFIFVLVMGLLLPTIETNASEKAANHGKSDNKNLKTSVSSPDGKVEIDFHLNKDGEPQYQLSFGGSSLIEPSSLGFDFKEQAPMNSNFEVTDTSIENYNEHWEPKWGDKRKIKNHYKQLTVYLQEKDDPNRKMNVEFRAFDDGVGFRYVLPEQENLDENLQITSENTEFNFSNNNDSWWIPNDWDSYEYNYTNSPLSEVEEVSTPFTMETPEGIHMSVHEAALVDYSGMALKAVEGEDHAFESHLAPWPDSDVKVKKDELPIETPWRTIQVGDNAGDLVESDMIMNLNEPTALEDTSWIEPMKYVGVWWEMISGKSTWESGPDHGATTENAKKYIDFASEHLNTEDQNIGLLVEGWNIGWDGNWIENGDLFSFTESYPDYDLEAVVDYAEEHGVEYMMHNETSGDILNYEDQMDEAYDMYQRMGIHAIKSGYVADHGIRNPEGQHHHGQYMVNHYLEAVKKAADHEIMINMHEPIKGTGLERTYPNWMSREGVSGMEYSAFGLDNNPPEHDTILPFTRQLGGPMDFTPGIFDTEVPYNDGARVDTTRAKQLALYVTISSGVQMVADLPENYLDEDGNILPEFQFIHDVPVTWDETMVPNAEIGDYTTTVRRSGDEWYMGSITDEHARDLEIDLDFLENGKKYVAEVYSDESESHYEDSPHEVTINKVIVDSKDTFTSSLAAGGGQAVKFTPATKEERKELQKYEESEVSVSYEKVPETIQSNDTFEVTVNVSNDGTITLGKNIEMIIDSEVVAEEKVRVDPGETKEVSIPYDKLFEPGDHQISVNDLESKTIKVEEKEPVFKYSNLEVSSKEQEITATAKVTNFGSSKGTVEVPMYLDGKEVDSQEVQVPAKAGGGTKEVAFTHELAEKGIYEVAIGDLETQTVTLPSINLSGEWLFQKGDNEDWKEAEWDDSDWQQVTLPSSWEEHSDYTEDNVYGWYRKTINIPAEWEGHPLKVTLGKIDDVDITYFNGEKIGQSGEFPTDEEGEGMDTAWDQVREYEIPTEAIKYGQENEISIRVFDGSGGGGLYDGPLDPIEIRKLDH